MLHEMKTILIYLIFASSGIHTFLRKYQSILLLGQCSSLRGSLAPFSSNGPLSKAVGGNLLPYLNGEALGHVLYSSEIE